MLKNKKYVSMSDVINYNQNLKDLEDKIEGLTDTLVTC